MNKCGEPASTDYLSPTEENEKNYSFHHCFTFLKREKLKRDFFECFPEYTGCLYRFD